MNLSVIQQAVLFGIFLVFSFSCLAGGKVKKSQKAQTVIHAELVVKNCTAEIMLNDIPIERLDGKEWPRISEPVATNLKDGINRLELVINPGTSPSTSRTDKRLLNKKGISVHARLVSYPVDVYPSDVKGDVLIDLKWEGGAEDKEQEFPVILQGEADLGKQYGEWIWANAEKITLDEKTITEINGIIRTIHSAYSAGNSEPINLLMKDYLFTDISKAYGVQKPEDLAREFDEYLKDLKAESPKTGWRVLPLKPEEFDFRVVGNGKLVQCLDKNWKDVIQSIDNDGDDFPFWMMLAKINGKWVIAR